MCYTLFIVTFLRQIEAYYEFCFKFTELDLTCLLGNSVISKDPLGLIFETNHSSDLRNSCTCSCIFYPQLQYT